MTINDSITELLLTSWDLNKRSPRFFTKWSYDHLGMLEMEGENGMEMTTKHDHHMSLLNMTMATSSTPFYFSPAKIKEHFYISGDNIAMSPAMYAFYYANERLEK